MSNPNNNNNCSTIRIAFCVYTMNAGTTTRSVEIANAVRNEIRNHTLRSSYELCFFSYRIAPNSSSYENLISSTGIPMKHFDKDINDEMWHAFLEAERTRKGLFPPPYDKEAATYIRSVIDGLRAYHPNVVIHGLFPEVSVACQILKIPTLCFGPIPMDPKWIMQHLFATPPPERSNPSAPPGGPKQSTLVKAALECGWNPPPSSSSSEPISATSLLQSDECLVSDLPDFYQDADLPPNTHVIGPIFAQTAHRDKDLPADLSSLLTRQQPGATIILISMGSSGDKPFVLRAIKAVSQTSSQTIVTIPKNICPDTDISSSSSDETLFVTNAFLPLPQILPHVNVLISHGGQGTVQSALQASVPIVGVAMQPEQEYNLNHVEELGAGIQLKKHQWTSENIRNAVLKVLKDDTYKMAACRIGDKMKQLNGSKRAAELILKFVETNL